MSERNPWLSNLQRVVSKTAPKTVLIWGNGRTAILLAEMLPNSRILSLETEGEWIDEEQKIRALPNVERHLFTAAISENSSSDPASFPIRWLTERCLSRRFFDLIVIEGPARRGSVVAAAAVLKNSGFTVVCGGIEDIPDPDSSLFAHAEIGDGFAILSEPKPSHFVDRLLTGRAVRHSGHDTIVGTVPAYRDEDVTFFIHCYRDGNWMDHALSSLRECYPASRLLAVNDGEYDPNLVSIARRHRVDLRYDSRRLFKIEYGGLVVHRMLGMFLENPTRWLFKIDPDTKICRRFKRLPAGRCLFGTLQKSHSRKRKLLSIQGGCVGHDLRAARELFESGLFTDMRLARYGSTWAKGNRRLCRYVRSTGQTSMDWMVGFCAGLLGIPMIDHEEVRSRWRTPQIDDGESAVIHPCRDILALPRHVVTAH